MRRGFTLIDVLVTLAVMAILMSLLLPSLSGVRETARQVICRSNVRQLGIGVTQFAGENVDKLPYSSMQASGKPFETMYLRIDVTSAWDGLGILYIEEFMPAPLIFYCPSHHGTHPYLNYADSWATITGDIVGNYQYRGRGPITNQPNAPTTDRLSALAPGITLIVDGLRSVGDFNHEIGANVFRADSSVAWVATSGIATSLPPDATTAPTTTIESIWSWFDRK